MFDKESGPGDTAIGFTNQFFDAAVAKIDKKLGAGFAKANPILIQAYIAACAANLNSFMQSAVALQSLGVLDEDDDEDFGPRS